MTAPIPTPQSGAALLEGQVVVCTGAGSGIGRGAVEAFLGHGARVAVLDRDPTKVAALGGLGSQLVALAGDATTAGDNEILVAEALSRWGRVDAAVTFVGVFDFYTSLADIPDDRFAAAFEETFALNVASPLLTARAATAALVDSGGTLIFTLSSSSFYPGRGGPLYVASKFALRGALLQLAHELAPRVRVNGVAPGGTVGTDLRGLSALGSGDQRLDDRPGRTEALEERTPLRRALTPADHAGAYLYLLSSQSRGLTGEIIRSDGGLAVR